jgi:cytochrome c553
MMRFITMPRRLGDGRYKAFAPLVTLCAGVWLVAASFSAAAAEQAVFGDRRYEWGRMLPEQLEIFRLTGDLERGKEAFHGCRGCHKPDASGLVDGTYPRLSGQHASVVIKQVTEVRAGIRVSPKMGPFSSHRAISTQDIADIAVFLESVQSTSDNGKGPATMLALGKSLYDKGQCASCHGDSGEGKATHAYPVVASQHFGYLVREMQLIQRGQRGNSHPRMVKAIAAYSAQDIEALADYMSRMPDYRLAVQAQRR